MFIHKLTILLVLLATLVSNASAGEFCGLADGVTEKAVVTFEKDQNDALKLFIIARELCPNDAGSAYNLGVAYYRYGLLSEAQKALEEAVLKDTRNAVALNNLAQVILELEGDSAQALHYAERAVERINSPATQDTLARARFAAGESVQALDGLHKALLESPEQRLQDSYDELLDRYLSARVKSIKAGREL